ncbi:uncharacterized protein B0T23DRAFT_88955 [Neurospora hispaniola]|uniref:Secreted protein n=1 Tax=Neurospora hispaniola TaxID=588809 RepID=A0AAJ0IDP0_9PEZI|nr:hypothetical protein B0T23DRAFT_88955 [Neurospora hispaniola]
MPSPMICIPLDLCGLGLLALVTYRKTSNAKSRKNDDTFQKECNMKRSMQHLDRWDSKGHLVALVLHTLYISR